MESPRLSWWWLSVSVSFLAIPLLIYSQTSAFTFDEAYHLLAAQLIVHGKRPYIDFCFPQMPLNTYWNAILLRASGPGNWHLPHLIEALFVAGSVCLTAGCVFRRFPIPDWRLAAGVVAAVAVALNPMVFEYGAVAQPYGMSLFALLLAFDVAIITVDRAWPGFSFLAGVLAGCAVASTLLVAVSAPVFLAWTMLNNRAGARWRKAVAFCVGVFVPFIPVIRLFIAGPRQTWFNLIQYHLHYRKLYWANTTRHDLEVLISWIDSGPSLLLGILAAVGLFHIVRNSRWPQSLKAEVCLCVSLAVAETIELSVAHPVFAQYFLFIVPFLAIPAAVGLYALFPDRPREATALVALLCSLGLAKSLYDVRDDDTWRVYERLASKMQEVAPDPNALLFADEPIYFLTGRTPPSGFELFYTHKLGLPAADAALFRIIDYAEMKRRVQSGMFAAAYSCDKESIGYYGLNVLYIQQQDMGDDCIVYWNLRK